MGSRTNIFSTDRCAEVKLLLGCARAEMQAVAAQQIEQALQEKIDWNYVMDQAAYHGTIPLLYRNLAAHFSNRTPQTVLDQLRSVANGIACWNLALTAELLKLLQLFQDRGIRALPVKGPALAVAAYGDLSLRQFCDLDILVSKADMLKAKEVLMAQGYHPDLKLTAGEEDAYLKSHHDYKFVKSKDRVVVEIQWGITQWFFAFPFDFDDLWNRRQKMSLTGAEVASLAPEDLLLILCVHGTKHYWEQLKWTCDITELINAYRQKLDWNRILDRARRLGGERMLLLGLFLAHHLVGAGLNEKILERIEDERQVKQLGRNVAERLFRGDSRCASLLEESPFFYWKARERVRDKCALFSQYFGEYFFRMVIPNTRDRVVMPLPAFLAFGYYAIRPFRLLCAHWSGVLQRFYR